MAKLTLDDLASLANQTTAIATINANNTAIETAMENTLSRDGTSPNTMGASLDMNSNRIINLPAPSSNSEPVRLTDLDSIQPGTGGIGGSAGLTDNRLIRADGTGGATIQNSTAALTDAGALSGITDITATGSGIFASGLQVGLSGTPTADRIDIGDTTFYLDFNSGTAPSLTFDTGDYLKYTRSSNTFALGVGASDILTLSSSLLAPGTSDGVALGSTTKMFSDLFLASGAVLNFNNGDVTVTHGSDILTVAGGGIKLAAGTTSIPPISFTSGTNLTTPAAGDWEYDGKCFYSSESASNRGVAPSQKVAVLSANYTLTDTATAQKAFNLPSNGTLTVSAAKTYFFEAQYLITNTGTNAHTWGTLIALGGGASLTSGMMVTRGRSGVTSAATLTADVSAYTTDVTTVLVGTASSTSATENVILTVHGVLRMNAGGTITPQVKLSATTGGTITMLANSYFRIWAVGDNTVTTVGNWA